MSTGSESTANPAEVVRDDILRYGNQLVPGAAEQLAARWIDLAKQSPEKRAETIATRMASPMVDRFRNPEFVAPKLENGAELSPLRASLARHSDRLRPGAVDELSGRWAIEMAGKSPAQIEGEVVRRLGDRNNNGFLSVYIPEPPHERRVIDLLQKNFADVISLDGIYQLARERGRDLQKMTDQTAISTLGKILSAGATARRYGATVLPPGDKRASVQPSAQIEPTKRDADGRFQAPPAKPRRGSNF